MTWIFENYPIVVRALISTIILYLFLIAFVRVNGLRSFAKMTSTDLVVTVLLGNVLSTSIMYDNQSILKSVIVLVTLLAIQALFSRIKLNSISFRKIATNKPKILVENGQLNKNNLTTTLVSEDDLRYKLRKAGITQMNQVAYVVFETTGEISILKKGEQGIDEFLMEDIFRE